MGIQMLFRALICVSKVLLFCKVFFFFGGGEGRRVSELVILNHFVRCFEYLKAKSMEVSSNMYI